MVVAIYVLYNFIGKWNEVDVLFKEKKYEHLNYDDGELHEIEEEIHVTPYISNSDKEFAVNLQDNIA